MRYLPTIILSFITVTLISVPLYAQCSLDHLIIGRNEDSEPNTPDDNKLFIDSWQKYRHSDPDPANPVDYRNWYYPLFKSFFPTYPYRIGEPGFDVYSGSVPPNYYNFDPNRCPSGIRNVDYQLVIECVAISPGLVARLNDYLPNFYLSAPGDKLHYSQLPVDHIHFSYRAEDNVNLYWISFCVYDELDDGNQYQPSEPFTIVFNLEPLPGDLYVDGSVDIADLTRFVYYWLCDDGSRHNDFYERADADRNGFVNLMDFAFLAANNYR